MTTPDKSPTSCPRCGAKPRYEGQSGIWKCGSYGSLTEGQSDRCRIAELEQQLAAAREEIAQWREKYYQAMEQHGFTREFLEKQ